jgi:[ribosomal protein S18]-alanine N-acetyltransferase
MSAFIREAILVDAPLLASLHEACFEDAWDAESFRRLLQRSGSFVLLAGEAETDLQAFILIQLAGGEAEIQSLGTRGVARRKGFAASLVASAARESFERGAGEIFLEVALDNGAALALYECAGFRIVGRRPQYYPRLHGPPVDAAILRAGLPLRQT